MPKAYHDVAIKLKTERGPLTVYLAQGGEQFPWASHKGKVITGSPDGSVTSDGTPMNSLEWHINPYWVVDAVNSKGDPVELTPEEYGRAVASVEAPKAFDR